MPRTARKGLRAGRAGGGHPRRDRVCSVGGKRNARTPSGHAYCLEGPQRGRSGTWGSGAQAQAGSSAHPARGPRFFFTGPLSHYFYLLMERWIPPEAPLAAVRRLLLERLLFAPAFLCLFFVVMDFLEVGLCSGPGTALRSAPAPGFLTRHPWVARVPRVCELVAALRWQCHTFLDEGGRETSSSSACWSQQTSHSCPPMSLMRLPPCTCHQVLSLSLLRKQHVHQAVLRLFSLHLDSCSST